MRSGNLCTSIIVVAELREGALGARDPRASLEGLDDFLAGIAVLPIDGRTVEIFAQQRLDLRRAGTPIPDHDLWIASSALQHDLVLLTRDADFDRIAELRRA
jgi:tRNA(fMet)-specific endonuclease VapC